MSHFTVTVITVITNRQSLATQTLFSDVVFDLFYLLSDLSKLPMSVLHFPHFYLLFLSVFIEYLISFVHLLIDVHFCLIFPFTCLFVYLITPFLTYGPLFLLGSLSPFILRDFFFRILFLRMRMFLSYWY